MVATKGHAKQGFPRAWIKEAVSNRDRAQGCWTDWPWTARRDGRYPVATGEDGVQRPASHLALLYDGRPRPDLTKVVLHSCDDLDCVNPAHMKWGTQPENIADMKAKGRAKGKEQQGSANSMAKLNEEVVRQIREDVASGMMQKDAAVKHGISKMVVSNIVRRKAWVHVV